MHNDSSTILFHKYEMHSLMHSQEAMAMTAPNSIVDDTLLNSSTDDLVTQLVEQYRFDIPVIDRNSAEAEHSDGPVEVYDVFGFGGRPGPRTVQGSILTLTVPYSGDRHFFDVQPTTYDLDPPRAVVGEHALVVQHMSRELQAAQATAALNSVLDKVEKYLSWLRASATQFNENLPNRIRQAVEARKAKVLRDRDSVANIGFKLKARLDAPKIYVAPLARKPIFKSPSKQSQETFKPEPALDNESYEQILKIIQGMALVFERSPSAFRTMGEEDIRQHFLVQLNGHFEGAASGETFNFTGKTDILIRVEGRNIFIAECKFWSGPKAFSETIDQLLGYLTWRDTKAAVIIFNRNLDFSNVLKGVSETANAHPHKKQGPVRHGETRFSFVFGNPFDHNREIHLAVLVFDVPMLR